MTKTKEWRLVAVMFDGTEKVLNPDSPFIGDVFDAGNEADRLTEMMDGVESLILEVMWFPSGIVNTVHKAD